MIKHNQKQLKALIKLHQFYERRKQYDQFFSFFMPKWFSIWFFKTYRLENSTKVHLILDIIKFFIYGLIPVIIFSFFQQEDWTWIIWIHALVMFIYIFSAGALISYKAESHKHNVLMLMIEKMRVDVLIHQIKQQLFMSYVTAAMPITLFIFIRYTIMTGQFYFIPLFILWHAAIFFLSRYIVLIYYHVAYQIFRHSYFRGALFDVLIIIFAILLYVGLHTPVMFIDPNSVEPITYILLGSYTLSMSLCLWLGFGIFIKRYVAKNQNRIFYPLPEASKKIKRTKYLSKQSLWLTGLNEIEKEIVIKDQKTLKRQNKKTYYGILFYGFIAIFASSRLLFNFNEPFVLVDVMADFMIAAGSYFMLHMIATAFAKPYVSYSSEGSLTRIYERLSVPKWQVYRAKRRLFYLMTVPLIVIFLMVHSLILIRFSWDRLFVFIFISIYLISIIRIKLHTMLFGDMRGSDLYVNDQFVQKVYIGGPILLGLLVGVVIPVGIGWFTHELSKTFDHEFVYIIMGLIIIILLSISIYTDSHIKKSLHIKEVSTHD